LDPGRSVNGVCLVTDIRLYREVLSNALERHGVFIVGAAAGVEDAVQLVEEVRPNVVLLDMATAERMETVHALLDATPGIKIVALGVRENEREVIACAEAGVSGFVTRDSSIDDLVATVKSVARGEARCSPRMAAALLRRVANLAAEQQAKGVEARLTPRECDILGLIENGLSNKEIARELHIEISTVKNHVHNLLGKLNVRRRGEAAAYARRALVTRHSRRLRRGVGGRSPRWI
jgi:two-component system, NarL family, nitrate/nitrite response regulator NarL